MGKLQGAFGLSALELMRIAPMPEASRLAGVDAKTLKRKYPDLIIKTGKRREGMRVHNALHLPPPTD